MIGQREKASASAQRQEMVNVPAVRVLIARVRSALP